ncbi:hypothetical protein M407DRAFT_7560 [Tulasnella calospora MUT 4182]|uniref:Uncharacterized protein n=1 Tax=Tulasnella calospora MUT 4182 TaxID=1051891 RepID=A0A0C3M015_9AGAM|nr:hypothetical protein M407DRAFT_7560 [Tulasnella calospora MUT 4182]
MDFVTVAFERSGQVPIHLEHIGNYQDGQESPFLDKVLPHVHRWESLAIHQPSVNVAIQYFSVQVSAPKIKSILLSSLTNGSLHQRHICSFFGGGLANLEELRVYFWGDIGWRGLNCTRLRILDIEREQSLDLGAVLNILAANPCLESLRIHDVSFAHYPQPGLIPAPLPLDHLKELTLTDVTHAMEDAFTGSNVAIGGLLQRIKFRTDVTFTLRMKLQTDSSLTPQKLTSLIPSPVEHLACLSGMDGFQRADVTVGFGGTHFLLKIQDSSCSKPIFSFEVDGLPQQVANEWVVESLRQATTTPVDLRLRFGSGDSGFSLDEVFGFQLWDSVMDLTLTGNFYTAPHVGRNLLRLLSTPCMSEDGLMVMPFPKLQHLCISRVPAIKGKYMLAMVQARFALPGSTEAAVHSAVPVPLTIRCGLGVGGWINKYQDRILAIPGVEGIRAAAAGGAPWTGRSSSSSSSEPEWPPGYYYNPVRRY